MDIFLKTGNSTLVEASPSDNIYGIGLSKNDLRSKIPSFWKGENLLGETLTLLKNNIKKQ